MTKVPPSPTSETLSCAAFSKPFKLLALAIVAFLASWMYQLWAAHKWVVNYALHPSNGLIWLLCSLLLMIYTLIHIYRSQTTLSGSFEKGGELSQTWIWNKHIHLQEMAYAKLIRIKGLEWLIAPRLYVRTGIGKFSVFYAADPRMVAAFENLQNACQKRP